MGTVGRGACCQFLGPHAVDLRSHRSVPVMSISSCSEAGTLSARGRTESDQRRLEDLADYLDDAHWQERTREGAGIAFRLRYVSDQAWLVFDDEPSEMFDDARVAEAVAAWFKYKGASEGARLSVQYDRGEGAPSDDDWRLALTMAGNATPGGQGQPQWSSVQRR